MCSATKACKEMPATQRVSSVPGASYAEARNIAAESAPMTTAMNHVS